MRKVLSKLDLTIDQKTARDQQVATRLHKGQINTLRVLKNEKRKIRLALSSSKRERLDMKGLERKVRQRLPRAAYRTSGSIDGLFK